MYDPRRSYQPDQQPPNVLLQSPGWADMGEDQPIDIAPAANAFKERFLNKPQAVAPEHVGALGRPAEEQAVPHMMQGVNPPSHELGAKATSKSL